MRRLAGLFAVLSLVLLSATPAPAASGDAASARAMLDRAVVALKSDESGALTKFNAGSDGFRDGDLYVFCFSMSSGQITAHPRLVGTDIRTLKDSTGKAFGQATFDLAREGQVKAIDYVFPRPSGGDPVPKESFVTRAGGEGCAVGYYK